MKTPRQRDLAKIHLAKKDLQIDDDTYGDILWTLCRVRSARDLDVHGRAQVLAYFRKLGWRPRRGANSHPGRPHNVDSDERLQKIEALLADMRLPWSYADALAARMYQVDKVAWVRDDTQLAGIITALSRKQAKLKEGADNA